MSKERSPREVCSKTMGTSVAPALPICTTAPFANLQLVGCQS
jgi:hypothetical protein